MLRPYQQRTIDKIYNWFSKRESGNPCVVLPTGSGKSHVIAAWCKDLLQNYPEIRILMLTHVKELIEQNAEKMLIHWPDAPMGIYSAGIGRKDVGDPIMFAGIQSIRNKPDHIGWVDIIIVDECHLIQHEETGGYRQLIDNLKAINPSLCVVGLTATPYRLGHGLITDKPAIFDEIIEPATIEELIALGYLSPLKSKFATKQLDVSGVKTRGGDYIESELQKAVDVSSINKEVAKEIVNRAGDRKAWLVFCAGIKHSINMAIELEKLGILVRHIDGDTTKKQREETINDFKIGKIRAVTNCAVLTTGFDYPDVDLIAFLRPTKSPGLYVQMAGRGMRIKSHTDHCLILDFAGLVMMHGPITAVKSPQKWLEGGIPPMKPCPQCAELVALATSQCPECGHEFPPRKETGQSLALRNDDIMGIDPLEMVVTAWNWEEHTSRNSGKKMLCCSYFGGPLDPPIREYFAVTHEGPAGMIALKKVCEISKSAGVEVGQNKLYEFAIDMNNGVAPSKILYKMDGKYHRVVSREWSKKNAHQTDY